MRRIHSDATFVNIEAKEPPDSVTERMRLEKLSESEYSDQLDDARLNECLVV
jgi:hypothetical protein